MVGALQNRVGSRVHEDHGALAEPAGGRQLHPSRRSVPHIFVLGQDRPEATDAIRAVENASAPHLYGVIVAVPDKPSPLAGSLLYQGVGRLTQSGVKAGMVEPALLHAVPTECERYARHLFQRLSKVLWQHNS